VAAKPDRASVVRDQGFGPVGDLATKSAQPAHAERRIQNGIPVRLGGRGLASEDKESDSEHDGEALEHQTSPEGSRCRAAAEKGRSVAALGQSRGRDALPLGHGASWDCSVAQGRGSR
jgi:hypothetical protein